MKKAVICIVCILLALSLLAGGAVLYILNSPEYALLKICEEVKNSGFSAVEANMTQAAKAKVEPVRSVVTKSAGILSSILSLFSSGEEESNYAAVLIEKAQEIEWSVGDILKNRRKATVTIGFDYNQKIVGSIDLELLRIDKKWLINDLYNLEFETFEWKP